MTSALNLSLGECEALAQKALRGVGCHWGLAQEGAFAVGMLSERGVPALRALVTLTKAYDEHGTVPGPTYCPLTLGIRVSDSADAVATLDSLVGTPVLAPALFLPFAARALNDVAQAVVLEWSDTSVRIAPGLNLDRAAARSLTGLRQDVLKRCVREAESLGPTPATPTTRRAEVWPACRATLEAFAHRTYVPASAQSRASGAGGAGPDD